MYLALLVHDVSWTYPRHKSETVFFANSDSCTITIFRDRRKSYKTGFPRPESKSRRRKYRTLLKEPKTLLREYNLTLGATNSSLGTGPPLL